MRSKLMRRLLLHGCTCVLMLSAGTVAMASCLDEIDAMAARYNLALAQPTAPTGAPSVDTPVMPDSRARSASDTMATTGGIIAPSTEAQGDRGGVLEPPRTAESAMPTMPAMPPQAGSTGSSSPPHSDPRQRAAADHAKAEASLAAVRVAAMEGQESRCRQHLHDAQGALVGGSGRREGGG